MRAIPSSTTDILHYRRNPETVRLLDLGCGDGERAIALAGHAFNRVTGLDPAASLVELAVQRAARRKVEVSFVCGDPRATPFAGGSFDAVMLLGDLFGRGCSAREDMDLLREARRLLTPNGRLHLRFADGDWIRQHHHSEVIEGLPTGFIYRHGTLSDDGRHIRTEVFSSDEWPGIARHETHHQWLYTQREITDLLHRLGFGAISYDPQTAQTGRHPVPHHVVHCRASPERTPLRLLPR